MKNNLFDYIVLFVVMVILTLGIFVAFTGCSHFKLTGEKVDVEISSME